MYDVQNVPCCTPCANVVLHLFELIFSNNDAFFDDACLASTLRTSKLQTLLFNFRRSVVDVINSTKARAHIDSSSQKACYGFGMLGFRRYACV